MTTPRVLDRGDWSWFFLITERLHYTALENDASLSTEEYDSRINASGPSFCVATLPLLNWVNILYNTSRQVPQS